MAFPFNGHLIIHLTGFSTYFLIVSLPLSKARLAISVWSITSVIILTLICTWPHCRCLVKYSMKTHKYLFVSILLIEASSSPFEILIELFKGFHRENNKKILPLDLPSYLCILVHDLLDLCPKTSRMNKSPFNSLSSRLYDDQIE